MHPTPPSESPLKLKAVVGICSEDAKPSAWGGYPDAFCTPECRTSWELLESEPAPPELLVPMPPKELHSRLLECFSMCLAEGSEPLFSSDGDCWGCLRPCSGQWMLWLPAPALPSSDFPKQQAIQLVFWVSRSQIQLMTGSDDPGDPSLHP